MKQKYFYHEHLADYAELKAKGLMSRGELYGNPDDFNDFSSKLFLVETLPRLDLKPDAQVLELGCGTGPVACFLAKLGYRVHGIDVIPDAIDKAKAIAAEQSLNIHYEVLDVCQLPRGGEQYQLVIDSFCLQGIVTDPDRDVMFSGIKSRLAKKGNSMADTNLKITFNTAPTLYEEVRPGYPAELIRDVIDLSGLEDHSRVLEIGCGTGKATRPLAERGYELVCLDIGADLIAIAQEKLKAFPNVSFVTEAFEAWRPGGKFDLIISATAFHWVDPKVRYLKAAEVLRSDGFLAVFSNQHVRKDEGFFAEVQNLYDRYYLPGTVGRPTRATNFPGVEAFHAPIRRVYPWTQTYSTEEYIKLLNTYSDHIALPDENKRLLFEGITDLIETKYDGQITKYYEAVLDFRETK